MSGDWDDDKLHYKYDPLPDEVKYRKKAKKTHLRSDHKHEYELVCVDTHSESISNGQTYPIYYTMLRCKVCGRLDRTILMSKSYIGKPPENLPLYEVTNQVDMARLKNLNDEHLIRNAIN